MTSQTSTLSTSQYQDDDYVTIVAPSIVEVMDKFRSSGMAAKGYKIAGRVCRHTFAFAGRSSSNEDASAEMFDGDRMMAATFVRPTPS